MLHDARQRVVGLTASNNSGLTWDSLSWGLESDGCVLVMFLSVVPRSLTTVFPCVTAVFLFLPTEQKKILIVM